MPPIGHSPRRPKGPVPVVLFSLCAASPSLASSATMLLGIVHEASQPLAGATVTLELEGQPGPIVAHTNVLGEYHFTLLPAGRYTVTFRADEHLELRREGIVLAEDGTYRLNAELPPGSPKVTAAAHRPGSGDLAEELRAARTSRSTGGSDVVFAVHDFLLPGLEIHMGDGQGNVVDGRSWKVSLGPECVVVHRLEDDALAFIDFEGQVYSSRRMCGRRR